MQSTGLSWDVDYGHSDGGMESGVGRQVLNEGAKKSLISGRSTVNPRIVVGSQIQAGGQDKLY